MEGGEAEENPHREEAATCRGLSQAARQGKVKEGDNLLVIQTLHVHVHVSRGDQCVCVCSK